MRLVPIVLWGLFALGGCVSRSLGEPVEGVAQTPDGARLPFRKLGNGPGLLVATGAGAAKLRLTRLALGRMVVLCQPRSPAAPGSIGFDQSVADLETLRRWLGLERFVLLATGESRAVAAGYAARHPERVDALVLVGPPSIREPGWTEVAPLVACPTLVLEDPAGPAAAGTDWAGALPAADVRVEVGRSPWVGRPDEVADEVDAFLGS